MNKDTVDALSLETGRYELYAEMAPRWKSAEHEFFEVLGGGIVVVFGLEEVAASGRTESGGRRGGLGLSLPQEIGPWLHISEDGTITGYTGKVEFGQGIRTSLTQIIADELSIPLAAIHLVMGDTDLSPFDGGTTGSRTTPVVAPQIRKVAAAAREILLDLAAEKAQAERTDFFMENGVVVQRQTKRTFTVAELARDQTLLKAVGEEVVTRSPSAWQAFSTADSVNGRALVTGAHRYTSDFKRPQMLHGKVLRPPSAKAELVSLDTRAAEAIPGVVLVCDGDFVGVVAPDVPTATRALAAIRAEWRQAAGGQPPSTDDVYDYLKNHPAPVVGYGGPTAHVEGSVAEGFAGADHVLESTYTVAYIAHAPLETRAAVAEWSDPAQDGRLTRLTVWTGTQRPFGVRGEIAEALDIGEDHVRIIVPDTGSGYGGKHTGDAALEAARLARAAAGKPVKIVWTREEEFAHAYFRPAGLIEIRSGVQSDGTLTAWEHHNYNSGSSGMRTLYRVPHQHIEFHASQSPLRQGSYRALAATANHFARETHLDELAHTVRKDPLAFRRENLDDDRLLAVLEAAAAQFGWNKTASPHHGFGIAGGHEKGSYVATCAHVFVDPETGALTVVRAVTAFECGAIMHEDNVRNQVDGAVLMGLGGALFERIVFENGEIRNGRFSEYRVPRFRDVPILETVLLDRKDLPSVGAGETPIVAIAPAIGNAVFAATGVRLRSLPLSYPV